ncbi:MAG TPA: DUF3105 domain-containing protein [Mycobacteriales bacterium]|nr:DUF3105 domain-containing protein [Mycobacteriales bacterium]
MRRLLLVLVLALTGCSAGEPAPSPDPTAEAVDLEPVTRVDDLTARHVEGPVDYARVPPLGGDHLARWVACGAYDEPVPDEAAVHSLEHGAVWVTYDPALPADDVAALEELVGVDEEYVLVSPYEGLPSPVVVSAWGLQIEAERPDDPRVEAFVQRYVGNGLGGEQGAPCRTSGLPPEQARELVGG